MTADWNMKTFMKGASILAIATLLIKLLAATYRVPYQNIVGDQGFYIYQQVYPFVGVFIVWTSYGLAVAVSKVLAHSESKAEAKTVMYIAFGYFTMIASMIFIVMNVFAPIFAHWMGDPKLTKALQASAYVVLFMPFTAVLKGLFQSAGRMLPVAVANISEQLLRVFIILGGTWVVMQSSSSLYVAGELAIWGTVMGQAAGVVILLRYVRNHFQGPIVKRAVKPIIKKLTIISLSMSASSLILLLFQMIDSFMIYKILLSIGYNQERAMITKGVYDRGQPLVQLGILLASTLSLAIVPLIAYHLKKKEPEKSIRFIQLTYRTAFLFGWAASLGMILILPTLNEMLFQTRDGSTVLAVFVFQIFWLSFILPITAILQGAGRTKQPFIFIAIGLSVKVLLNGCLVPVFDILGAAIASNVGLIVITIGLMYDFKKQYQIPLATPTFYRGVGEASLLMMIAIWIWELLSNFIFIEVESSRIYATIVTFTSVVIGASVFIYIVMRKRLMTEKDWYILPFGKRLAKLQLVIRRSRRG